MPVLFVVEVVVVHLINLFVGAILEVFLNGFVDVVVHGLPIHALDNAIDVALNFLFSCHACVYSIGMK